MINKHGIWSFNHPDKGGLLVKGITWTHPMYSYGKGI